MFTDRRHGDLGRHLPVAELDLRRAPIAPLPWTSLEQVHGAEVVEVQHPGHHRDAEADAAVTTVSGAVLTIQTADCAPIALVAESGAIAVAHAGWRGLVEGVVHEVVGRLRSVASGPYHAFLGPCIGPECYEFGDADLRSLVAGLGEEVRSVTSWGRPALDLRAAVDSALDREGIALDHGSWACTACGGAWYSHRARQEHQRQALVCWIDGGLR